MRKTGTVRKVRVGAWSILLALLSAILAGILLWPTSVAAQAADDLTVGEFLATFEAYRGSIAAQDDGIVYTLSGSGSYAEVSTRQYVNGSQWNVTLTTRDTVMLRLKNETSATTASLYFKSVVSKEYDLAQVFDLATDGEWHTYYIRLGAHANARGILHALKLVPDASEGSVSIAHISFEREKPLCDYAGEITSATSDGLAVTVTGTLSADYADKTVSLYRTDISNMQESIAGLEPIALAQAQGNAFTFTVPHHDGEISLLSSTFIAAVDDVKVAPMFKIENWRDFCANPYAFTLPDRTVRVTDAAYGAKGDGYTDDTAAIQAAIDDVSAQGGGTVILPGDDSAFGVRYIATTVWMKSKVELRIEKGAVLWQSPRESDYRYPEGQQVRKGHDAPSEELGYDHDIWAHNGLTYNYPLIYAGRVDDIKITGGGTVRLADTGQNSVDSMYRSQKSAYCYNLVHLIPIGVYKCNRVEISDLTILRTNCYNIVAYACDSVYIGNVDVTENNCLSGDGISLGLGTKNVVIDRCMLYTSDDTIVLCAHSAAEPRGKVWWKTDEHGGDNRLQHITIRHSAITPGNNATANGLVIIAWGNDVADLTMQAFSDIEVYDNILGATPKNKNMQSYFVNLHGAYGAPYGNGSKPLVPAHDFRIHDNSYRGTVPEHVKNLVTDGMIADCENMECTSELQDTAFSWKLAYWQYTGEYGTQVTVDGATAKIQGKDSSVYQAPQLAAGQHTFTVRVKTEDGADAHIFARNASTGEIITVKSVTANDWHDGKITFTLKCRTAVELGVENAAAGTIRMTQPVLSSSAAENAYFGEDFETGPIPFAVHGWQKKPGEENTTLAMLERSNFASMEIDEPYTDASFGLGIDFFFDAYRINQAGGGGFMLRFRRSAAGEYRVRYDGIAKKLMLEKYAVNATDRSKNALEVLAECDTKLLRSCWYRLSVTAENGALAVYLDDEKVLEASDASPLKSGGVKLSFANVQAYVDNLQVAESDGLEFAHSVLWAEGQGEDPDPVPDPEPTPGNPDDTITPAKGKCGSCASDLKAGSILCGSVLLLVAGIVVARRRKASEK